MSVSVGKTNGLFPVAAMALLAAALTLLGSSPEALFAQGSNPPPQDMPFTLTGSIIDHSPGKITVSGAANMEFDVRYDSKTEIQRRNGSAAAASDLKVGIDIQVKGSLTEAGVIIAKKIVIESSGGSSKKQGAGPPE